MTTKKFLLFFIGLSLSINTIAVYASNDDDGDDNYKDDIIRPSYPKSEYADTSPKTDEEYSIILSNMSGKTTRQIEELVSIEKLFTEEEKTNSLYNTTSICEQLLKRPDVSASGILDCKDILNQTKAMP